MSNQKHLSNEELIEIVEQGTTRIVSFLSALVLTISNKIK